MADNEESRIKAMKAVEAIFERYHLIATSRSFAGFDLHLMRSLTLLSATSTPQSTATFSLLIEETYSNMNNVMHGGAAGVIFDMCTTSALGPIAKPGFWDFMGGVTRTLNISYLKAIPVGTKIHLHSVVTQAGRTMAHIRGTMMSEDGKTIYCTCEHHKVSVPTLKEHLEFKVPWDEEFAAEEKVKGDSKAKL